MIKGSTLLLFASLAIHSSANKDSVLCKDKACPPGYKHANFEECKAYARRLHRPFDDTRNFADMPPGCSKDMPIPGRPYTPRTIDYNHNLHPEVNCEPHWAPICVATPTPEPKLIYKYTKGACRVGGYSDEKTNEIYRGHGKAGTWSVKDCQAQCDKTKDCSGFFVHPSQWCITFTNKAGVKGCMKYPTWKCYVNQRNDWGPQKEQAQAFMPTKDAAKKSNLQVAVGPEPTTSGVVFLVACASGLLPGAWAMTYYLRRQRNGDMVNYSLLQ